MIYATRKSFFCAAHRYYDEKLSAAENEKRFGKCVNTHGHNYELEVTVAGDANPRTGMVVNLSELDAIIRARVLDILDHKNLQADVDEFRSVIPTTEMIAQFIWRRLDGGIPGARLFRVRLYEDSTLFVDCFGEGAG
ncbi:MAG: 6-carboxytetrahydropterin synthase, partial [Chitinivibrionia bacterium]|nr:6-carboxytetrahydropterin synthase [Chitinivibrionia bacterium]